MSSHVFYPTTKKFETPFSSWIECGRLLALKNYHIWILYGNGQWYLFDGVNNKIVNNGKLDGDITKYAHIVRSPQTLGEDRIVFANCGKAVVEVLNPFTGKYDDGWHLEHPTMECVPQNERSNDAKMTDAVNETHLVVLNNSRRIVLSERKESNNADYIVTVIEQGSKERKQAVLAAQSKNYLIGKLDEDNKVILFNDCNAGQLNFAVWDLSNHTDGFKTYNIGDNINTTVIDSSGWGKDTACLFGNSDVSGIPEVYLCNTENNSLETVYMDYLGEDALLNDIIFADARKKKVLVAEQTDDKILALFDGKNRRLDFMMQYENDESSFRVSTDKKYFVEYTSSLGGDNEDKKGETELKIYSLVNKKMFLLYLMKKAVVNIQGEKKSLLGYYGNPFVSQQIADMFSG